MTHDDVLEHLLALLSMSWFFSRSIYWSSIDVSNVTANRTKLLGKCFAIGQKLGAQPLHDGICSFCGELLYGKLAGFGNKACGPPTDYKGRVLQDGRDTKARDHQPPFLLRYSGELIAYEIPAVFEHDPESNRLAIAKG